MKQLWSCICAQRQVWYQMSINLHSFSALFPGLKSFAKQLLF